MANTATPVQTSTTTWNIDPAHSMAEFKVKHMMIANVKGQFSKVSGALFLDESDLANSRVEASIEAASIHTRDQQRDAHLKLKNRKAGVALGNESQVRLRHAFGL
jgi:polyisoprenoid-binding protein YceI